MQEKEIIPEGWKQHQAGWKEMTEGWKVSKRMENGMRTGQEHGKNREEIGESCSQEKTKMLRYMVTRSTHHQQKLEKERRGRKGEDRLPRLDN